MLSRNIFFRLATKSQQCIQTELQFGCHNYAPLPVVVEKAQGIYLWDCEGKKYFDFISAYSAVNQGHCHPRIYEAMMQQAKKVTLTSRAIYNDKLSEIEKKLCKLFGYQKALMMNSGVEAGESAIKIARRWGYASKKVQPDSATVLFAKGNFWGRTIAACASSDDPQRYLQFGPFSGLNFQLVDYGSISALEQALSKNKNVVAFMVEPIQGEKGVVLPPQGYLRQAHNLLKKYNALLIADQIQTGLGRTGKLLCSGHDQVHPDLILLGKALSGGFYPISAVLCDDHIMGLIKPGEHGSTYGGNPLASAIAVAALDVLVQENLCENSERMGKIFIQKMKSIMTGKEVKEVRGKGLFCGVEFNSDKWATLLSHSLLKNGLLAKPTQKNIIRFSPPLIIKEKQIEEALAIIQNTWNQRDLTL